MKQEADNFKISANMPYIKCSKKFETSSENYNFIFLPASRYFVAILNISLRNWNTYYLKGKNFGGKKIWPIWRFLPKTAKLSSR